MSAACRCVLRQAVLLMVAFVPLALAGGHGVWPTGGEEPAGTCDPGNLAGTCDTLTMLQKKLEVSSVVPALPLDSSSEKALENVLKKAAKGGDAAAANVETAIEADDKAGLSTSTDITLNRETILEAIEKEESSVNVDDAVKEKALVTSEMLQEIFGENDTPEVATPSDEEEVFQGDMRVLKPDMPALVEASRSGHMTGLNLWPQGPIKYCFDPDIAGTSKQAFLDAVKHFQDLIPCLKFEEVLWQPSSRKDPKWEFCAVEKGKTAIAIQSLKGQGCNSHVGNMKYFDTNINLEADGCDIMGIAAHELGHAIGVGHEQSRPDRDAYVKILWGNIKAKRGNNFVKKDAIDIKAAKPTEQPFDFLSLMFYGPTDFGVMRDGKKQKTIEAKAGEKAEAMMGNRWGLTQRDAQQIASMYGCAGKQAKFKVCTIDPNDCTAEPCTCHGNSDKVVKVEKKKGGAACWACLPVCSLGSGPNCGCGPGKVKNQLSWKGSVWFGCKEHKDNEKCPSVDPDYKKDFTFNSACGCGPGTVKSTGKCAGADCFQCKPVIVGGCGSTLNGCCPGTDIAAGPNGEGCPQEELPPTDPPTEAPTEAPAPAPCRRRMCKTSK